MTSVLLWCVLLGVALLYGAAVRSTAGITVAVAAGLVAAATVVAAVRGWPPEASAGVALSAGGVGAVVWAFGRAHRRRRTRREALAAHRAARARAGEAVADAVRLRMAAELHDTAAHRLTGIAVAAASALHVADPALRESALRHAGEAAGLARAELAGARAAAPGLAAIDTLVEDWAVPGGVRYRRTAAAASPEIAAAAYRVVREALTNAARYATGARLEIAVLAGPGRLTVEVSDTGGEGKHGDLGTGHGLSGLATTVASCGGTLTAGPDTGGWTVRAAFPAPIGPVPIGPAPAGPAPAGPAPAGPAPLRGAWWRGRRAWDAALAGLAVALTIGASLLPGGTPAPRDFLVLGPLFVLHALPLWWRVRRPGWSLAAMLSIYPVAMAGWTPTPAGDLFLWAWWVELAQLYAFGAHHPRRKGVLAIVAVGLVGGLALALGPGISGNRTAVWAVLAAAVALLSAPAWAAGVLVGGARARRRAAETAERDLLRGRLADVARGERERIAEGLRGTAVRHADAVVAAAGKGDLQAVLDAARAGIDTLRRLLDELRRPAGADGPPPTLAGLEVLAARRQAGVRHVGDFGGLAPELEVGVFRAVEELGGERITVSYLPEGVLVEGTAARRARRRLHALADGYGGALATGGRDDVRVWLPR
ncbi:sensor histidine kinase [Nonomuraea sp. NPDC051191]|uniref:sensor histidine kinase n=1 Tax=Nonomuraea sp. NPDC051191 TaxID=3364372 RepID=UPI00378F8780